MLFSSVLAQGPADWGSRCKTNVTPPVGEEITDIATLQGLECVFANIISIAVVFAGLAVFLMLITGGLKYLTSGGDPKAVEAAQKTMTFAVLGLVIIIAAYLILNFLSVFTGIPDLLKFVIPGGE